MRLRSPSSRGSLRFRLSLFDTAWAIASPLLALYFRGAYILALDDLSPTLIYCSLSLVFSLIAFSAFRIEDGMTRYFSVHDAVEVTKAVVVATFMTYIAVFTLTRLEGVPRSTPIIHALILAAGLIGARISSRLLETKRTTVTSLTNGTAEHILLIGSNRLSLLYIKFIRAYSPELHHIAGVLDDRPTMIGRAIDGVRVIGPPDHLEPIVNEFAEHGIRISHVIVGGDPDMLSPVILAEIRRICEAHEIRFDFVPELIGLQRLRPPTAAADTIQGEEPTISVPEPALSSYFVAKKYLDLSATVTLLIVFLPLWILLGLVALWDVGSPVFFWQQRLGQGGRPFLLHKLRTLKPPFDWRGQKVPDVERISAIGRLVRKCRLDEMAQLLNVLVGDMSLIGPRPLLPRDQPANPSIRLSVRPGITGWAQVNGGKLLSPEEKDALDEWYISNASLRLDLRITFMTLRCLFQGERRCENTIAEAFAMRRRECTLEPCEILPFSSPAMNHAGISERVA